MLTEKPASFAFRVISKCLFLLALNFYSTNGLCADNQLDHKPVPSTGCSKYFRCETSLVVKSCENGFIFNEDIKTCLPASLKSSLALRLSLAGHSLHNRFLCNAELEFQIVPGTNQTKYYACEAVLKQITCPDDELFSEEKKECVDKNQVSCGETQQTQQQLETSTTEITSSLSASQERCPYIDYKLIKGTNCQSYYVCDDLMPIKKSCAKDEIYLEEFWSCAKSKDFECQDSSDSNTLKTNFILISFLLSIFIYFI